MPEIEHPVGLPKVLSAKQILKVLPLCRFYSELETRCLKNQIKSQSSGIEVSRGNRNQREKNSMTTMTHARQTSRGYFSETNRVFSPFLLVGKYINNGGRTLFYKIASLRNNNRFSTKGDIMAAAKTVYLLAIVAIFIIAFAAYRVEACYGCPFNESQCNTHCKSTGNSYGKCQSFIGWTCVCYK
ncbi:hypothetical protein NPIL_191451 [Nephila pilipes]|uniref:Invertebrate defensins family profile domain-containing protein n=1 Tax=Nephila pilipes TaxID=299642 RepID=A0A8X6TIL9_NEPPI|nr:hypothetical protein NPIL_191451 [Nephila pilipes]